VTRLAALAVALLAFAAGCGGEDTPPLPEGRFVASRGTLTPEVQLFAEPVVAKVDVIVDRERFDPDRVRITGDLKPYEREGDVVRERRDLGRYTHLHFELTFRCLTYDCLPEVGGGPPEPLPGGIPPPVGSQGGGFGERKTIEMGRTRVVYDDQEGTTRTIDAVDWRPLQSVSRLNFGRTDVTGIGFPFEASVTPLPAVSYRVTPGVLATGFLLAALALLALPAVLVARVLRREPEVVEESAPDLTPLERALALVEWARDRSVEERREALEALATELDEERAHESADRARRLAWAPAAPTPEAMDELIRDVKEAGGAPA